MWWQRLKKGEVRFAVEDPDHPANFPRVLFLWRANLLGASSKGHEYFLKHLLGTDSAVLNTESPSRPQEITWREHAPEGKLDLLVTLEIRMSTSAMYADVALPAAGWYEMHDINTTDMHPFIHPFNPAIDPPWEARTNWDQFKTIAAKFSELAAVHLKEARDLVATPLLHDSPGELAQADVKDWRKGECEPVPGKTMPNLSVVFRDYANAYNMMTALGPLAAKPGVGSKGLMWPAEEEYAELKEKLGTVTAPGVGQGRPSLATGKQVAETILTLAPETNGAVAMKSWGPLEKKTGLSLTHLSAARQSEKFTFDDLTAQPRKIITSPVWSGIESEERRYSPFVINIEEKVPFRTLTGRAHFYLDHPWMRDFGEGLPLFRPPVDMSAARLHARQTGSRKRARAELPHAPLQVVDPQHLLGHPHHADALPRRRGDLDQQRRCRHPGSEGRRMAGVFQRQRRGHGQGRGQPPHPTGQGVHVPRPGTAHQHAGLAAFRQARRHPQQRHPHHGETHPHDRRLRPVELWVQLLRPRRLPARRADRGTQGRGGRVA